MHPGWKKINLAFIFLFLIKFGMGQYDCVFEHLSTERGLSHGSVSAMLKDVHGFMWFATWDGINRYDGNSFKIFKLMNTEGSHFTSNRVEFMKEDSLGNIWIITYDSRTFRLNQVTEQFDPIPGVLATGDEPRIKDIYPFSSGDVWVLSANQGAYRVVTDSLSNSFSIVHFDEQSRVPLPGNNILFIGEDSLKNIWINTEKGISCLKPDQNSGQLIPLVFQNRVNTLLNCHQLTSFCSSGKWVYFGTDNGQLLVFNPSSEKIYEVDFQNHSAITNITRANNGAIYMGTAGNGLFEYNQKKGKVTRHFNQPEIKTVLKIVPFSDGLLWVESTQPGISKIDLQTGKYRHYLQKLDVNPDIRPNTQCGLMKDEHQTLWLTLKGGGFGYYNLKTDQIEYFYNKPGDPQSRISNFVNCFYKDPSGVLWLSTYFKGIEKVTFIQKKFHFIQPAPQSNLSIANEVRAMLSDSKGYLWVATKKQELFLLDNDFKVVKKIDTLNGQETGMVYALLEDSNGNIYLGTKGNGLFKLTRTGELNFAVHHYTHNPNEATSLSNNNIYSLLEDSQGHIWIGTYGGGLNLLVNNRFFHPGNAMRNYPAGKGKKVRHLAKDEKGNIWAGTTDGLLFVENNGVSPDYLSISFYSKENGNTRGLRSNDIFWILSDRQNRIWMASLGGGLAQLQNYPEQNEPLRFSTLTKEDGLSSDDIFTITDDENGNLWMSTENGITYYNPNKHAFRNYSRFDGIVNSAFSEAACAIKPDGSICLGANNGFYSFYPSGFIKEQKQVPLVFTGFQLFGKEIVPGNESVLNRSITQTQAVRLKYNQNVFGITWAGLDYKMQDNIRYAYKLDGFDNNWQYVNDEHQANYTKLPPGKYTFEVRFINPELQALNHPKSMDIEILPPPWKTNWAYITYFILAVILFEIARRIFITIVRLRNKVVIEKKLTDIKLNFFTHISHELRTPLTLILGPANELKTNESLSDKGYTYVNLVEQNALRLLRLVNQLLDFRKIQSNKMELDLTSVDVVAFTQNVCRNFEELAHEKNIRFKVRCSPTPTMAFLDVEKMDSVIFNLLSNAFKFTPDGGSIEVSVHELAEGNTVSIEIIDSGIGIPKEQEESLFKVFASHHHAGPKQYSGTGIGLALSKELIQLHDGALNYRPNPDGGAIFEIVLKTGLENLNPDQKIESLHPEPSEETAINPSNEAPKIIRHRPTILVVEDNEELRTFLHLQLADEFGIEEAANGHEGLKKALRLQPDLILTDVMMPVMDGIQMLDKIKNNFETSHIPVVLLTAKSSVESKIEGLQYGADAYMTKPFNSKQLKAQLNNLLHQRVVLRESFANHTHESEEKSVVALTNRDSAFLNQVREIIEANLFNSDFRIEDFYKPIGMGRSKFFDKIKGLTGLSPIDFVKEYRLNKAVSLLKNGDCNVSEASYLSGFTDAGYFSKCFKERFGINPSEVVRG